MCSYYVYGEKTTQELKRIEELHRHNTVLSDEIQGKIEQVSLYTLI